MEFTELIKTSRVENVVCLRSFNHKKATGTLCLTSHHILFADRSSKTTENQELMLLYTSIEHVERKLSGTSGILILYCKNFTFFKLKIPGQEETFNIASTIEVLSTLESAASYHPFFLNRLEFDYKKDGWDLFSLSEEYNKLIGDSKEWRISAVNHEYQICSSYPKLVVVNSNVNDEILKMSGKFRQFGRFPVLSYLYNNKVPILRSGQPIVGINNRRCKEDEKLLSVILTNHQTKGTIIDTRSTSVINSHKSKGGGCESDYYTQWRKVPQSIEKTTHLGDTVFRLNEACSDSKSSTWLLKLEASGWMRYIESCMSTAKSVVDCVSREASPVLVHGENGTDLTLVITSLAQVMLNPECRTIIGLEALVVREWIWAGYPFTQRHMKVGMSPARKKEHAAVFILFLDCVHQLLNQYASTFEYNQDCLMVFAEHSYFSSYGTFLFNTECQRGLHDVHEKTKSLWTYLNREEILKDLRNPLYHPNDTILLPSVYPQSFTFWDAMFLKSNPSPDLNGFKDINNVIRKAKKENDELKLKAKQLKEKYEELLQARGQA